MSYPEVLSPPGRKVLMLGNVAIARGALEYGIGFASAYPGTPSTEIIEALAYAARKLGAPYVEWSVNEKVALEAAYGAAASGVPALAAMKHVGVNVAADPLFSLGYTGVESSLVIVSADDPWMWSSQNEQDNRWYGVHAYIPVVEPAGPQEAKQATIEAFALSEKFKHPVILRSTTRISHTRVVVETSAIPIDRLKRKGFFRRDLSRWNLVPANARKNRLIQLDKWEKIAEYLSSHPLNRVEGPRNPDLLIVAAGLGYTYAKEAVEELNVANRTRILKLSTPVPLPRKLLVAEASNASTILFVEEGDPVVETLAKTILYDEGVNVKAYGKLTGHLPRYGELELSLVKKAIASILGLKAASIEEPVYKPPLEPPPRPPVLCPGCPYRTVFYALKRAVNKLRVKPVYNSDIGCYSLGLNKPFEASDTIVEMGGSIGLANGIAHSVEGQMPIAIIGDSTFFHAGMPPLLNAVYNKAPIVVLVMDNHTTAMTGHQPHPGIGVTATGEETYRIRPEQVARGLGVEFVEVADAFQVKDVEEKLVKAIKYVIENRRPAVVVARGACILLALANARRVGVKPPVYRVVEEKCTACGICYTAFNCPAIFKRKDGKAYIDPILCTGCGECVQICPFKAFEPVEEPSPDWLKLLRTARPL
ncbi:MAG: indolepyruvate ferredoxin oxidoreductase subunit alpha [Pyrodictiaceae archaeon]